MAKSRKFDGMKLARNTRRLQSLPIGTPVAIQNQSGRYPTKWDKTGVIRMETDRGQGGWEQEIDAEEQEVCT
jgi:hypothetical protein